MPDDAMPDDDPAATTPSGEPLTRPIPVTAPPNDESAHEPVQQSAPVLPAAPVPAAPKKKFTDRLWSLRAVVAVAVASVLLGGAGGAALAAVSHDNGQDGRARFGPRGPGFGGPGNGHFHRFGHQHGSGNGFGQQNGQQNGRPNGQQNGQQNRTPSPSPGGPTT